MRPAQLTPENQPFRHRVQLLWCSFNEAGAINAGKLDEEIKSLFMIALLQ